tara:strand:+ start:359 stop:1105 length:747 start_codon:yes stop_codon:yes gene_type:complete
MTNQSEQTLTIVAVADTKIKMTIDSLKKSQIGLNYEKVLLITSKEIKRSLYFPNLEVINIEPIRSFKEYNNFIIYELYKYIKTTHLLLVQWDGFVLESKKWKDEFYLYDYIGAPFIPRVMNKSYSRDKHGKFYSVGNGGFSFRSFKLLEAPTKYNLRDDFEFTSCHEDGFFCILHRNYLESKGFKWATFEIAKEFAIESPLSFEFLYNVPFGFHGKRILKLLFLINLIKIFSKLTLKINQKIKFKLFK